MNENCNCEDQNYCGDCEMCELHKEGTFQVAYIDYDEGEEKVEHFLTEGDGQYMETICYDCFRKINGGELA